MDHFQWYGRSAIDKTWWQYKYKGYMARIGGLSLGRKSDDWSDTLLLQAGW